MVRQVTVKTPPPAVTLGKTCLRPFGNGLRSLTDASHFLLPVKPHADLACCLHLSKFAPAGRGLPAAFCGAAHPAVPMLPSGSSCCES